MEGGGVAVIDGEMVYLITDLVHLGVRLPNGVLLTAEPCNVDDAKIRQQIPADPDGEARAGLEGRGHRLCARCLA